MTMDGDRAGVNLPVVMSGAAIFTKMLGGGGSQCVRGSEPDI